MGTIIFYAIKLRWLKFSSASFHYFEKQNIVIEPKLSVWKDKKNCKSPLIKSHQNREWEGEDITKLLKENNTTDLIDIKKTMLESGNAL